MDTITFNEVYPTARERRDFLDYGAMVREHGGENPHDGDDLVLPSFGCPGCHERRPDFLLIGDDERVTCQSCGAVYGDPVQDCDDDALPLVDWYTLAHPGACM